jgi:GTP-binding protein Era
MQTNPSFRCGTIAIVGRPNVGKSTLLNRLIGQKLSITSRKPQTTRHRILGIKTTASAQLIYVDTPGVHRDGTRAMNRYMNRAALTAIHDVDAIVFVTEGLQFTDEDQFVLDQLRDAQSPVLLVINKVDEIAEKERLLPHLQHMAAKREFADIFPLSARKGDNVEALERKLVALLPEAEAVFPEDQLTDRNERFLAAEFIREKLMRALGQEVPYALTVEIEQFKQEGRLRRIAAVIWVEREGQKRIVIGKSGEMLKNVGKQAREDMEKLFGGKVFLELWVKVREGWSDDERALRSLGYTDEESNM